MRLLPIILFLISCSHLPGGRTYMAQMSREDGRLFEPHRDFPVVAGDSGTWGYSEEVRRLRTPASLEEKEEHELSVALKWELRDLEAKQSKEAYAAYEKYSRHFETISERIYYLRLPYHERYSYLESRGIVTPSTFSFSGNVSLGMDKDQVISVLGRPQRVEIAGNPSFENERWLYAEQGAPSYVYFEGGKVEGWD